MIEHLFKNDTLLRFTMVPSGRGTENPYRDNFRTIPPSAVALSFLASGSDQWPTAVTASAMWLPWDSGCITETALVGRDVFSGPFSGCWMVAYRDGPVTYAGHIGTDVGRSNQVVKRAWNNFAAAHANDVITGFNPFRAYTGDFPPPNQENPNLFGLMTANCRCFTICAYAKIGSSPLTFRIIGIKEVFGNPSDAKNIFRNDPEVHDIGLPFNMNDWKASTSGGAFHTRSTQLKNLDTALAAYFQNPCVPTLNNVRPAFNIWKTEKRSEYQNPTRNRRNCFTELENYLAANR